MACFSLQKDMTAFDTIQPQASLRQSIHTAISIVTFLAGEAQLPRQTFLTIPLHNPA